jgi:cellulose synthase/poly-beta-1,6-N-acetylglucosamine synthase-like glycosyltransferase
MFFEILAAVLVAPAALVALYYLFLAAVGPGRKRRPSPSPSSEQEAEARHRFLIVIPAHNEEAILPDVIQSCSKLDYPPDRFEVVVIADNCTDRTAWVALTHGAQCLERDDLSRRGKGPALAWALNELLPRNPDAFIVLDADCRLDPHALRVFDERLTVGASVMQARYVAANPDESPTSYAAAVANVAENDLFYAPKSRLGLAVLLRGTGMVFRRRVLERVPWRADSIVEDAEFTIRLLDAKIGVEFVPEVRVWSAFPARSKQLGVQRTRWIAGTVQLALAHGLPLMGQGLGRFDLQRFDLGWTLFAAARTLVLLELLVAVMFSALAVVATHRWQSWALFLAAGSLVAVHGLVLGVAAERLGFTRRRWQLLTGTPRVAWQFLTIAAGSLLPGRTASWQRTPR